VEARQLLAVVWSKDLGDKKAALIDAVLDLDRNRKRLQDLEKLYQQGAIPLARYAEAQRTVQKDLNAVNAAERTLRNWKLSDEDIEAVKREAATIEAGKRNPKREKEWARVEVRAPLAGTIMERNVHVGDVVTPETIVFRVADLSRLAVLARAPELDLAGLRALPPDRRGWTVRAQADANGPSARGALETVGPLVDPASRTGLVRGWADNAARRWFPGQAVTVTVRMPPASEDVAVPVAAVLERQGRAVVFIQPDPKEAVYALRPVVVTRRVGALVHLKARVQPEEERRGLRPVRAGERVVTAGAAELLAAWPDRAGKEKR
jgi:cobalt-zinc-cadmium efflux system membrane fusion protein